MSSPLDRYTLDQPPMFENLVIAEVNTKTDWVVRKFSIPVLFSVCKKWDVGEYFSRADIAELPILAQYSPSTKMLYATLITTWAVRMQKKYAHKMQGDFTCGLEPNQLDMDGKKRKYLYRRTIAVWLFQYIEEEEKKRNLLSAQQLEDDRRAKEGEKPLEEHGISEELGLGLETGAQEE